MLESLNDYNTSIWVGGRPLCMMRFADDNDFMAGTGVKLQDLTTTLEKVSRSDGTEISFFLKRKMMVNNLKE